MDPATLAALASLTAGAVTGSGASSPALGMAMRGGGGAPRPPAYKVPMELVLARWPSGHVAVRILDDQLLYALLVRLESFRPQDFLVGKSTRQEHRGQPLRGGWFAILDGHGSPEVVFHVLDADPDANSPSFSISYSRFMGPKVPVRVSTGPIKPRATPEIRDRFLWFVFGYLDLSTLMRWFRTGGRSGQGEQRLGTSRVPIPIPDRDLVELKHSFDLALQRFREAVGAEGPYPGATRWGAREIYLSTVAIPWKRMSPLHHVWASFQWIGDHLDENRDRPFSRKSEALGTPPYFLEIVFDRLDLRWTIDEGQPPGNSRSTAIERAVSDNLVDAMLEAGLWIPASEFEDWIAWHSTKDLGEEALADQDLFRLIEEPVPALWGWTDLLAFLEQVR